MNLIQSGIIPLHGAGISMQGGRPENQDDWTFADTPLGFLLVVCDGMGGGPGGKTASYIVRSQLVASLRSASPQASPVEAMKRAVNAANDAVDRAMAEQPRLRGMGSTLVAALFSAQSALVAHLGDSRCYRISRGRIAFRTQDHSLVGELVRSKALTEEQARTSPQSNVIMRALGATDNHVAEIDEVPYRQGDRFVLCTDGVWGIMPHEQLAQWFTSREEIPSLEQRLSAEIDRLGKASGGHHDNHTMAIVELHADSILKDKMNKQLKMILGTLAVLLALSLVLNMVSLSRLGASRQVAALEEQLAAKEASLGQLQQEMALYQNVKNSGTRDLITKIEVLEYEKELLIERQEALIAKVDSLERRLTQQPAAGSKSAAGKGGKARPQGPAARQLAQRVLNLFHQLDAVKGPDKSAVVKKKAEYKLRIIDELLTLDRKTDGKYAETIAGIIRLLHSDVVTHVMYNEKNKQSEEYVTANISKQEIKRLVGKVESIMGKLPKE